MGSRLRGATSIRSDLQAGITKPYCWLTNWGPHIPHVARGIRLYDEKKAFTTAKILLEQLYEMAKGIGDHMEEFQQAYAVALKKSTACAKEVGASTFAQEKKALQARVQSGEMNNATYQKLYTPLRIKKEEFEQAETDAMVAFFNESVPQGVPFGSWDQLVEIINEPKLLFYGTPDGR